MKKSFICFVCLCFPLIAMSNEPTYHDTCQIQIYRNFSELTQVKYENFPNSIIRYNTDTKIGIEKLFKDKGYLTFAKPTSKKVMSLNIDTIFGTGPDDNDVTWVVSVTILDENHNEVYSEYYYDTRRVANISKEKVDLSKEDIRLFNTKEDYRVRLFYDAVSDHPSCARDDSNSTGHSLDDSIDAVLLGAREYAHKKYTKLPKEYKQNENEYKSQEEIPTYENGDRYKAIGILNNIPYCCTPDNNTGLCLRLKGNKEK